MSKFKSELLVKELQNGTWELLCGLTFESQYTLMPIEVPRGFKTDFASVPRIPLIYDALGGIANKSAVIHDWLYTKQYTSRYLADNIFLEAMKDEGVSLIRRQLIYAGVRLGGSTHWD